MKKNILSFATFCIFLLAYPFCSVYAIIPNNVTSNLTVSSSDYCNGQCFISPGVTLTVTGNFNFSFNGSVTVSTGGKLIIQNGATATFMGNVHVEYKAQMNVQNSTVRMNPGTHIRLRGSFDMTSNPLYVTGASLTGNNSTFTSLSATQFWEGIITMRGAVHNPGIFQDRFKHSNINLEHCTVERARNAISNYDWWGAPANPLQTSGGIITIYYSTFRNNIRSMRMYQHGGGGWEPTPAYNPNSTGGMNDYAQFWYTDFLIDAGFSPQTINLPAENPTEMVYISNTGAVTFMGCRFLSVNNNYGKNMTGIFGVNAGIKAGRYLSNASIPTENHKAVSHEY